MTNFLSSHLSEFTYDKCMIIGKSNHPVTVKRIEVKVWRLRDEIEEAIAKRLVDTNSDIHNVDIEDIKAFYSQNISDEDNTADSSELDSSGNPMDDDAMEMLQAMNAPEEDDAEAAALAMLEGQGLKPEVEKMAEAIMEDDSEGADQIDFKRLPPHQDKVSPGFTLLSDINMHEVLVFTKESFTHGSSIVLEFQIPKKFVMSAEVIKCVNISRNSKIISETRPKFRVQAAFKYLHKDEKETLRAFLESIEIDIPPSPKKFKRISEEDEDDFEDLGL